MCLKSLTTRIILKLFRIIIKLFKIEHNIIQFPLILGQENDTAFSVHNLAVENSYGKPAKMAIGNISESLILELSEMLKLLGTQPLNKMNQNTKSDLLLLPPKERDLTNVNKNLKVYPVHDLKPNNPLILKLHKELRNIFSKDIRSPFVSVNTRCWQTIPLAKRIGSNKLHNDGFMPGHMKIMVYLQPLDDEHGFLQVENKEIKNKPRGTAILFQNSDVLHSGVPGNKFDRISFEVTLMKTFINSPQINQSHFFGRHFTHPRDFYSKVHSKFGL